MDIKWTDDGDGTKSARVGSVILLVTPRDGGVWTAEIKIKYGVVDEATFACSEDAVRWCGRRLPEIVDPLVATARAEAALAEREACAEVVHDELVLRLNGAGHSNTPQVYERQAAALGVAERDIRARTTPDTLSTETLAAIAEARGLRVVEPELLAGIDATERDEPSERATCSWCEKPAVCAGRDHDEPWALSCNEHCAHGSECGQHIFLSDHAELIELVNSAYAERDEARAELAALRTELHEEKLRDNYRAEHGCGDNSCVVERPHGMATNGGCRCGSRTIRAALQRARAELASMRVDLAALTARMEAEIPAAAEAVRARANAECVTKATDLCAEYEARANLPHAKGTSLWSQRMTQAAVASEVAESLRALAAPQPAPTEPADVDPAAGALR